MDGLKQPDLSSYILPYPYEAFHTFNRNYHIRRSKSFEEYKSKIYGWVEKNTITSDYINSRIENSFNYVSNTDDETRDKIKTWLFDHMDKVKYIGDFSGLGFGVQIKEEEKAITLVYPTHISEIDKQLYPNYDEELFKHMDVLDKLEWMYNNCEFIPFRIIYGFYPN